MPRLSLATTGHGITTATPATTCEAWTACAAGEYLEEAGSATEDQLCGARGGGTWDHDGDTTSRNTPVTVAGLSDAVSVSAGSCHSCAVRETGEVVCWGWGRVGQLGDERPHWAKSQDVLLPTP